MSTIINDFQELSDVLKNASDLSLQLNTKFIDIQSEFDELKNSKKLLEEQLSQKESELSQAKEVSRDHALNQENVEKNLNQCQKEFENSLKHQKSIQDALIQSNTNLTNFIYGDLAKLEEDIRLLDISMKNTNKFDNKPLNIALIGGYSAGKTTFVQRLFKGGIAGAIEATPTTWLAIKHSYGKAKSFKVNFATSITIDDHDKKVNFKDFLSKYQFDSGFTQNANNWKINDSTIFTKIDWSENKIIEFLKSAEDFQENIIDIDWIHAEKSDEINRILKLCNIVDLPGIDGNEIHDKKTFEFISKASFDACIILIDTDEGIPNNATLQAMKNFMPKIIDKDIYWMYQKNNEEKSEEFIYERKNAILKAFKEVEISSEIEKKLESSVVIDAMGTTKDIIKAHNAMTKIIVLSRLNYIAKHLEPLKSLLKNLEIIPPLVGQINDIEPINPIKFISENFSPSMNSTFDDAYNNLKKLLKIDLLDSEDCKEAEKLIKKIVKKIFEGFITKTVDFNALHRFEEILNNEYKNDIELLQKAFLYKFYNNNELHLYYLKDFNSKAIHSIEKLSNTLKKYALDIK